MFIKPGIMTNMPTNLLSGAGNFTRKAALLGSSVVLGGCTATEIGLTAVGVFLGAVATWSVIDAATSLSNSSRRFVDDVKKINPLGTGQSLPAFVNPRSAVDPKFIDADYEVVPSVGEELALTIPEGMDLAGVAVHDDVTDSGDIVVHEGDHFPEERYKGLELWPTSWLGASGAAREGRDDRLFAEVQKLMGASPAYAEALREGIGSGLRTAKLMIPGFDEERTAMYMKPRREGSPFTDGTITINQLSHKEVGAFIKYIGEQLGITFTPAMGGSNAFIADNTKIVIERNYLGNDVYQIAITSQSNSSIAPDRLDEDFVVLMGVMGFRS